MENKKLYLLTVVDWGEWSAHGIVDSLEAAEAWKARGDRNDYEVFDLNVVPEPERWRDNKLFPHAPDTSPPDTLVRKMAEYANMITLENLMVDLEIGLPVRKVNS